MNALVDPDEAARHLPAGVRPHATGDGTVFGCCLVDLAGVRPARLAWSVEAGDSYSVRVDASAHDAPPSAPCEPIGGTCLGAEFELSPGHDGRMEVARMRPSHRQAQLVEVDHLESAFLASFATAVPAPSCVVRDVDVTWSQA